MIEPTLASSRTVVDRVAQQYSDLGESRREFKDGLSIVEEFAQRDPGTTTCGSRPRRRISTPGPAFGLTFADYRSLGTRRARWAPVEGVRNML
jgi:hypothetical protein